MDALIKALDDCLEKMQSGASLDEVLADYPGLANELRPLLEAAAAAKALRYEQPVSTSALSLSKARFLKQSDTLRESHKHFPWETSLRSSAALVYGIIIFCVLLLGTGIASAQSIPGDIFYPVKLASEQTRLFLVNDPTSRIELQESFDHQRVQEIDRLMQQERTLEISFAGFLTLKERDQWAVDGIRVLFPQNLQSLAEQMRGKYIEITGLPQSSGIFLVQDIQTRQFDITGTIEAIQPTQWTVSQLPVEITPDTMINGQPTIGGVAKLVIIRISDSQLQALQINVVMTTNMNTSTPLPVDDHSSNKEPSSGENRSIQREDTPQTVKTSAPEKEKAQPAANGDDNHQATRPPQDNSPSNQPISTSTPQSRDEEHHYPTPTQQAGGGGQHLATPTSTLPSGDGEHHSDDKTRATPTLNPDSGGIRSGTVTVTPHSND